MTNYLSALTAGAVLFAGACSAAEPPPAKPATATAAKPAGPAPAAPTNARVSAAPAGTSSTAAVPHFTQAAGGTLTFSFMQAGAESQGSFKNFSTELGY